MPLGRFYRVVYVMDFGRGSRNVAAWAARIKSRHDHKKHRDNNRPQEYNRVKFPIVVVVVHGSSIVMSIDSPDRAALSRIPISS